MDFFLFPSNFTVISLPLVSLVIDFLLTSLFVINLLLLHFFQLSFAFSSPINNYISNFLSMLFNFFASQFIVCTVSHFPVSSKILLEETF